jgi:hypothetical protein
LVICFCPTPNYTIENERLLCVHFLFFREKKSVKMGKILQMEQRGASPLASNVDWTKYTQAREIRVQMLPPAEYGASIGHPHHASSPSAPKKYTFV